MIIVLNDYFQIEDTYAYNLTRVKSAFQYGTITLDDFQEFNDEVIEDLADYIIEKLKEESNSDGER